MTIFCTGDIHGKVIERFSFKQHPELRQLKKEDIIFQLGDLIDILECVVNQMELQIIAL